MKDTKLKEPVRVDNTVLMHIRFNSTLLKGPALEVRASNVPVTINNSSVGASRLAILNGSEKALNYTLIIVIAIWVLWLALNVYQNRIA